MKIEIEIPDGHEIDQITFKPIVKPLPKSWEELGTFHGWYTGDDSTVYPSGCVECSDKNKNVFTTKEQAEASIALAQLSQLMKVYNNGWEADWKDNEIKHTIYINREKIMQGTGINSRVFLSFKNIDLANQFAETFEDLILTAKPLL